MSKTQGQVLKGTKIFMAPEVLASKGSSVKSDVYSWGIFVFQIVLRSMKDFDLPVSELIENVVPIIGSELAGILGTALLSFSIRPSAARILHDLDDIHKTMDPLKLGIEIQLLIS